jgi:hypothetical protein
MDEFELEDIDLFPPFAESLKLLPDGTQSEVQERETADAIAWNNRDADSEIPHKTLQSVSKCDIIGVSDEAKHDGGEGSGIEGHTTPRLSAKDKSKYDSRIVGQKTSSGVEVKSFSNHAYDRLAQRRISSNRILQMLTQTPQPSKSNPDCDVYKHNGSSIVIDRNSGKVVTVMWS